jgi:hypothetical protein
MSGAGGTQRRLLDPQSTSAVLLGAHDWTDAGLKRAPSFLRSARHVVSYLYDPAGLGLDPELVLDLFDDTAGAGDQLARVRETLDIQLRERREAGHPITDLLVYYIGHGQTDDQGHLSLLVRRSRRGMEAETGIKAPDLARTLRLGAPQQRRSVILDCCFSEAAASAFFGMAGDLNQSVAATVAKDLKDDQPARGTLLLCSSPVGEVSMGPPNAERTLFTGAVLEVLRQGAEGRPPFLSFADLRDAAFDRMVVSFGANTPRPVLHQVNATQGDLTRAPAFRNYASADARAKTPPTETPPPSTTLQGEPAERTRAPMSEKLRGKGTPPRTPAIETTLVDKPPRSEPSSPKTDIIPLRHSALIILGFWFVPYVTLCLYSLYSHGIPHHDVLFGDSLVYFVTTIVTYYFIERIVSAAIVYKIIHNFTNILYAYYFYAILGLVNYVVTLFASYYFGFSNNMTGGLTVTLYFWLPSLLLSTIALLAYRITHRIRENTLPLA